MNSFLYLSDRFAFERLCCPGDLRFAFELLCSTVDLQFGFEQLCFSVDPLSVSWYEGPVLRDNLGASRDQQTGCGGHGYLAAAALGDAVASTKSFVTLEGENTVLYLQVVRCVQVKNRCCKTLSRNGRFCVRFV